MILRSVNLTVPMEQYIKNMEYKRRIKYQKYSLDSINEGSLRIAGRTLAFQIKKDLNKIIQK